MSPGQHKRFLSQIWILAGIEVCGTRIFEQTIDAIAERNVKVRLIDLHRSL